jgi:hypothetical protein
MEEMTTLTEDEKRAALEAFKIKFPHWESGWDIFPGEWSDKFEVWLMAWAASKAAYTKWTDADLPLPEDEAINAAHPLETGEHKLYAEAVRMVGAKRSKYALVDLVNWLMSKAAHSHAPQESKWISVEDRLPNPEETVFTLVKTHGGNLKIIINSLANYGSPRGEYPASWFSGEALYWLPMNALPQPPTVEDGE